MAKQTAVEWLYEQLYKDGHFGINTRFAEVNELVSIAKAVEKEQIEKAFGDGTIDVETQDFNNESDRYYNETFKGGK